MEKYISSTDSIKDLDDTFDPEQAEEFMFSHYRKDFKSTVENILSRRINMK